MCFKVLCGDLLPYKNLDRGAWINCIDLLLKPQYKVQWKFPPKMLASIDPKHTVYQLPYLYLYATGKQGNTYKWEINNETINHIHQEYSYTLCGKQ